jgi:hypothetical protein
MHCHYWAHTQVVTVNDMSINSCSLLHVLIMSWAQLIFLYVFSMLFCSVCQWDKAELDEIHVHNVGFVRGVKQPAHEADNSP